MSVFNVGPCPPSLILYTRRFSALVEAGISLMTCFQLLQDTTQDPTIAGANAEFSEKVGRGMTLSDAMAERPELFSPFYIAFVRAGEIGGVLDEAMAYLATWLEQERDAAERLRSSRLLLELATKVTGDSPTPEGMEHVRSALRGSGRAARVASFCRLFEMCLTAGVPMKLALEAASDALEEPAPAQLRTAARQLDEGAPVARVLAGVEELQAVVAPMAATGEEHGCLDLMLRKAAEFTEAEATHILHSAAELPDDS